MTANCKSVGSVSLLLNATNMKCCKLKALAIFLSANLIAFYISVASFQNPSWSKLHRSARLQFVQHFHIARNHLNWTLVSGYDYVEAATKRAGQSLVMVLNAKVWHKDSLLYQTRG